MTPGTEALREAMRLEQAKIYGQTCPERVREPIAAIDERRVDDANRRTATHLRVVRGRRSA